MKAKDKNIIEKRDNETVVVAPKRERTAPFIFEEDKELVRELSKVNPYIGRTLNHGA